MATAVMELLASADATAQEVRGELQGFVRQVTGLKKSGTFSASDAKTYGPGLIKMVNTCVKQASQKEVEEERVKAQLLAAAQGIELLHMMSQHLACNPFDLDKICQNLVQKLVERGMLAEARTQVEGMILRLHRNRKDAGSGGSKLGRKYGISNNAKENKENNKQKEEDGWMCALDALLKVPHDAARKIDKNECALVVGSLANLATLSPLDVPLEDVCGEGCLLWAKDLAGLDADMAQRLCSNMYKASSKAAAAADARAKAAQPGSAGHANASASAVTLRQYSMVFLLMSGKFPLADVVAQSVKTAKFYEKSPNAAEMLLSFHELLLREFTQPLSAAHTTSSTEVSCSLLKSLSDWALCVAGFFVRSAGTAGNNGASALEVLAKIVAVIEGLMPTAVLALPSARAPLYLSSYSQAIKSVLGSALRLNSLTSETACAAEAKALEGGRASFLDFSEGVGSGLEAELCAKYVKAADTLRSAFTIFHNKRHKNHTTTAVPKLPTALDSAIQRTFLAISRACADLASAGAQEHQNEELKRCVDFAIACITIGPGEGYDKAASLLQRVLTAHTHLGAYSLTASVGLHNAAVTAYNEKRFTDANVMLRAACDLVVLPCEGLQASDYELLAKRHRMYAFSLHGSGDTATALRWAASAAVLLAAAGDDKGARSCVEDYILLRSSLTLTDANMQGETVLERSCLHAAFTQGVARLLLEAEVTSGIRAERPACKDLLAACTQLLSHEAYRKESHPVLRSRMLLNQAKLLRAIGQSNSIEVEAPQPTKGARKGAAKGRGPAQEQAHHAALGLCEDVIAVLSDSDRVEKSEDAPLLIFLPSELAVAFTWRAILQLERGWETQSGACESACAAVKLWEAHASMHAEGLVTLSNDDVSMAQEHILLLADLLSLHGQDVLSQHALGLASHLTTQVTAPSTTTLRLALVNALHGFPQRAQMLIDRTVSGDSEAMSPYSACLGAMARATVHVLQGDAEQARVAAQQYKRQAQDGFSRVRADVGKFAAQEVCAWSEDAGALACMQAGDGVGAARGVIAALHALMAVAKHMRSAAAPRRAGRVGEEEEGQDGAAVQGGDDAFGIGDGVRKRGADASQWRVLHEVAWLLARAGDIMCEMGRCKEADYYYTQGLELAKGCGSSCWKVRFTLGLASLRSAQELHKDALSLCDEASTLLDAAAMCTPSSLSFLEADRALLAMIRSDVHSWQGDEVSSSELIAQACVHVDAAISAHTKGSVDLSTCVCAPLLERVAISLDAARAAAGAALGGKGGNKGRGGAGKKANLQLVGEASVHLLALRAKLMARGGGDAMSACPPGHVMLRADLIFRNAMSWGHHVQSDSPPAGRASYEASSRDNLESLKVAELQERLKKMSLPTAGRKADLIERIRAASSAPAPAAWTSVSGASTSQELGDKLIRVWECCHPSGPPALIRSVGKTLAGKCFDQGDVLGGAFFLCASVGVLARQLMCSALQERIESWPASSKVGGGELAAAGNIEAICSDLEQLVLASDANDTAPACVGSTSAAGGAQGRLAPILQALEMRSSAASCEPLVASRRWVRKFCDALPGEWCVCVLYTSEEPDKSISLSACTLRKGVEPKNVCLGRNFEEFIREFDDIMTQSRAGLQQGGGAVSSEDKKKWWDERAHLDRRLGSLLESGEQRWVAEHADMLRGGEGGHTVLVLDHRVQHVPWENFACFKMASVSRMPSAAMILASLVAREGTPIEVKARDGYFVLNPSGDLASTQAAFAESFSCQPWEGVSGQPPSEDALAAALQEKGVFVFCGHGAGERYINPVRLRKLDVSALSILMGCSSGRLKGEGQFEPRGMALSYLIGGCPAAVANLWDVSDRDIDRFADALLRMGVFVEDPPSLISNAAAKAKEEPSAKPTPGLSILECITAARDHVRMRFLIGAAPVCYGLPVVCKRT